MQLTSEEKKLYVEIWSKAVETQMHFNEMSVKSRQFGLAFVAAALGLGIVLLSRHEEFSIPVPICGGFNLHATVLIVLASAVALYAVRRLDLHVYHRMIRGAVKFGEDFEEKYMKQIFDLNKGMTQAISHFSQFRDAQVTAGEGGKYVYVGNDKTTAEEKIRSFYNFAIGALAIVSIVLFLITANFGHTSGNDISQTTTSTNATPSIPKVSPNGQ